jgi:hypothetical protein
MRLYRTVLRWNLALRRWKFLLLAPVEMALGCLRRPA